jgi:hypothetical protein
LNTQHPCIAITRLLALADLEIVIQGKTTKLPALTSQTRTLRAASRITSADADRAKQATTASILFIATLAPSFHPAALALKTLHIW